MDRYELKRDVRIDPERLDVECMVQAETFAKWAEACVDAREAAEEARLAIDTVQADLAVRIRQNPRLFNISKVTDASVKAAVLTHPELAKARALHRERRRELGLLEVAVSAMEMKKRMLEELGRLHGLQYFAGPSSPRNARVMNLQARERQEKRVRVKQLRVARKRGES